MERKISYDLSHLGIAYKGTITIDCDSPDDIGTDIFNLACETIQANIASWTDALREENTTNGE